eukprot:6524356-Alexandrium_andersonii.AAC.1
MSEATLKSATPSVTLGRRAGNCPSSPAVCWPLWSAQTTMATFWVRPRSAAMARSSSVLSTESRTTVRI